MTDENEIELNSLDNWQLARKYYSASSYDDIIVGFVNGKFIKSSTLLYLDLDKRIAMTDKETFRIGEPNTTWLTSFLDGGGQLDNIEIKGTTH